MIQSGITGRNASCLIRPILFLTGKRDKKLKYGNYGHPNMHTYIHIRNRFLPPIYDHPYVARVLFLILCILHKT